MRARAPEPVSMHKSFITYVKLCVFRGNPADVDGRTPTLITLFIVLLVFGSALVWATVWLSAIEPPLKAHSIFDEVVRVLIKLCALLFVALCTYVVLYVRRVPENFRQTFSSYLGVSIIITYASLGVIFATVLMSSYQELREVFIWPFGYMPLTASTIIVVSSMHLVSTVWQILTFGYILSRSMEVKFWQGSVIAIMLIYAPEVIEVFPALVTYVESVIAHIFEFDWF